MSLGVGWGRGTGGGGVKTCVITHFIMEEQEPLILQGYLILAFLHFRWLPLQPSYF